MKENAKIKFSVCIPTFNCYHLLTRALDSALLQDFKDIEILIIDDCSDDGSWESTKALKKKDSRIKIVRNPVNIGFAKNWNKCIELSQGKYILILAHDDELLPGMIQETASFLDNHPNVGLVHSNGYDCTIDGRMVLRKTQNKPVLKSGPEALLKSANHNFICSSVVVRRHCYGTGFLTDNLSPDAEMYARIARDYDIGHIAKPLVKCYGRLESTGRQTLLNQSPDLIESQMLFSVEKIISYFPKEEQSEVKPLFNSALADGLWAAGSIAWRFGKWKRGQHFFCRASKYIPLSNLCRRYIYTIIVMLVIKLVLPLRLYKYVHKSIYHKVYFEKR